MAQATAYFCPACGSPTVERPLLIGGSASCKACDWKGPNDSLLVHHFEHDLGSPEQMTELFVRDVVNTLVKAATLPLGHILAKWGFLDPTSKNASQDLGIYIRSAGAAVAKAFVETREAIATGKYDSRLKGHVREDAAQPASPPPIDDPDEKKYDN